MKKVAFCFLVCCVVSCTIDNKQPCIYGGEDYVFQGHFQNCISIVSLYQSGSELIDSDTFTRSLRCLKAITGIDSHAHLGDVEGYTSDQDYVRDISAWTEWYANHMDAFSFDDAYIKFEEYRKENQSEVSWPPMLLEIIAKRM